MSDKPITVAERNRRVRLLIDAAKAKRKQAMMPPVNHMPEFPEHGTVAEMQAEMERRLPSIAPKPEETEKP